MSTNELGAFDSLEDASPDDLRARLHALALLLARAPVPIAVAHDPECRFVSANPALERLLGVAPGTNVSVTPPLGQPVPYRIRRGRPQGSRPAQRPLPGDAVARAAQSARADS
jgi:PAS domain-containing protein